MVPGTDMPDKVKVARLCLLVSGWLKVATAGLFVFILVSGAVFIGPDKERSGLLGSALLGEVGGLLAAASAATGVLDLVAAAAVRRRNAWGRGLGIVLGMLLIPLVPVGTMLGLFVLSGLLGAAAREWFSGGEGGF
jgi:hypothetical protein